MKKDCGSCFYWEGPQGDNDMGYCHRFPPVLVPGGVGRDDSYDFPDVHEGDWCGEWLYKEHQHDT